MEQTQKPIGRPTFRIDGVRLRALRNETGLTQQALAQKVYACAGKEYASPEVLKNTAQRWEASGAIPADMAKYLAEVLQTTVAILQGALPEPAPSRVDEIEGRLRELIALGPTPRLIEALAHSQDEENPTRVLAMHIASRLETAQLSQAEEEFQDLADLTGYNIRELQEPSSFEGFWMLVATGPLGPARTEILAGLGEVLFTVKREMQSCLDGWQQSDSRVSFKEEKHWFGVTISHPLHAQLNRTLRFVRCQPRETGLQWSSPTWQERYWVEELPHQASRFANFITGFDSEPIPADLNNLRFAITKEPSRQDYERLGPNAPPEVAELTAGHMAELHPRTFESFLREGNSHYLVVNRLSLDLWEKLQPYMAEWPMECWTFRLAQSRIDIILHVPFRLYATSKNPLKFGHLLNIMLYEVLPEGGQRRAPWRQDSVAVVHEKLMTSLLQARQEQTPGT